MESSEYKLQVAIEWENVDQLPDLITCPILWQTQLAINTALHLIICYPCGTGFTVSGAWEHMNKCQKNTYQRTHQEQQQVRQIFNTMQILDHYPEQYTATQLHPPFSGLAVVETYGCSACFKNGKLATIKQHFMKAHPTLPKPTSYPKALGQYINKGATRTLLRITNRPNVPGRPSIIQPLNFCNFFWLI